MWFISLRDLQYRRRRFLVAIPPLGVRVPRFSVAAHLSSNISTLNQDSDNADAAFAAAGLTACAQDPNPTS
jgi:hypothetical protein